MSPSRCPAGLCHSEHADLSINLSYPVYAHMCAQESVMLASHRMGSEFTVLVLVKGAFAFDSKHYGDNIPQPRGLYHTSVLFLQVQSAPAILTSFECYSTSGLFCDDHVSKPEA